MIFVHREEDLPVLAATELVWPVIYLQSAELRTGGQFRADKAVERVRELRAALGDRPASILVGPGGVPGPAEVR
ncbi:hypothetical protein AB0H34_12070 [Saccharopolyspora shandongensis]|uniref:hypothetical protein n=1 Tax=Saccharopolyspora shandongensis TaxID=418495 RepID=UPI0033F67015